MKKNYQQTLRNEISIEGIGLHSGAPVQLTLKPASINQGIVFVRTDLSDSPRIPAIHANVISTQLATTIGFSQKISISTIEHLMAAFQGLGVDNATVEVNGPELPILDGSSAPFVDAIEAAGGLKAQLQHRKILAIRKKVQVKMGEKWAVIEPSSRLEIHGSIEWDHPSIGYQEFQYVDGETDFSELASARTFCLLRDVEAMRKAGLAKGGSLDNAVVLDDALVLNPEGLRYPDEFIRHKVLDALGDFKLAGIQIQGFVKLHRAGHDLHSQLLRAIFSDASNYEVIDSVQTTEKVARPSRIRAALARVAALG